MSRDKAISSSHVTTLSNIYGQIPSFRGLSFIGFIEKIVNDNIIEFILDNRSQIEEELKSLVIDSILYHHTDKCPFSNITYFKEFDSVTKLNTVDPSNGGHSTHYDTENIAGFTVDTNNNILYLPIIESVGTLSGSYYIEIGIKYLEENATIRVSSKVICYSGVEIVGYDNPLDIDTDDPIYIAIISYYSRNVAEIFGRLITSFFLRERVNNVKIIDGIQRTLVYTDIHLSHTIDVLYPKYFISGGSSNGSNSRMLTRDKDLYFKMRGVISLLARMIVDNSVSLAQYGSYYKYKNATNINTYSNRNLFYSTGLYTSYTMPLTETENVINRYMIGIDNDTSTSNKLLNKSVERILTTDAITNQPVLIKTCETEEVLIDLKTLYASFNASIDSINSIEIKQQESKDNSIDTPNVIGMPDYDIQ